MKEEKLDKDDTRLIIKIVILSIILGLFLDKGSDIAILIFISIICHKYMGSTKHIPTYNDYEFLDEDKYNNGWKYFVWVVDLYVIVRIATILLIKYNGYTILEIPLLTMLMVPYARYLEKKYVKNIKNRGMNIKPVFIKNKVLTLIVLIAFIGFTLLFFNYVNKNRTDNFIKLGKYEYSLTYDKNNKKTVDIRSGSMYMNTEKTDENSKYFDSYIIKAKKLINIKIFERYSFIAMIFMFLLVLTQKYSKNKNDKSVSIISNVFLVGILIFGIFALNTNSTELENDLLSYFHKNLSNYK